MCSPSLPEVAGRRDTTISVIVLVVLTGVVLRLIRATAYQLPLGSIVSSSVLNRAFRYAACYLGKHGWHAALRVLHGLGRQRIRLTLTYPILKQWTATKLTWLVLG